MKSLTPNQATLQEAYDRLLVDPNDNLKGLKLYHSSVGIIHSLLAAKFPDDERSYDDVVDLLVEEGVIFKDKPSTKKDLVYNV